MDNSDYTMLLLICAVLIIIFVGSPIFFDFDFKMDVARSTYENTRVQVFSSPIEVIFATTSIQRVFGLRWLAYSAWLEGDLLIVEPVGLKFSEAEIGKDIITLKFINKETDAIEVYALYTDDMSENMPGMPNTLTKPVLIVNSVKVRGE